MPPYGSPAREIRERKERSHISGIYIDDWTSPLECTAMYRGNLKWKYGEWVFARLLEMLL